MITSLTNPGAVSAVRALQAAQSGYDEIALRVTTGLAVASARDDGARYAIAQGLRAEEAGFRAEGQSLARGQSVLDTAMAAIESVSDTLIEMQAVATALADSTLDDSGRSALETQYGELYGVAVLSIRAAEFAGTNLLDGSRTSFQPLGLDTALTTVDLLSALGGGSSSGSITSTVAGDLSGQTFGDVLADITGALTGEVIGNVVGDIGSRLQGSVYGDFTGDTGSNFQGTVTGDVTGTISGNVNGSAVIGGDFSGTIDGNLAGDIYGDFSGTITGNFTGTIYGSFTGTVQGNNNGTVHNGALSPPGLPNPPPAPPGSGGDDGTLGGLLDASHEGVALTATGQDASVWSGRLADLESLAQAVSTVAARFGTYSAMLDIQSTLKTKQADGLAVARGNLIDADLARDAAALSAAQVRTQLAAGALAIANAAPGILLSLFP